VKIRHLVVIKKNHQDAGKPTEGNLCVHYIRQIRHSKDNYVMHYSLVKSFGSML